MPRRKLSEFGRLRRKYRLSLDDCAELFGVTTRTIRNWDYREPKPLILDRLRQRDRHLSALHPAWTGFKIDLKGKLRGPGGLIVDPEGLRRMLLHYRFGRD
jgi:hypothetical protein